MTIQLDKITEIIESEKNKFIELKSDLSTKENLVYFKEKIDFSFSHILLTLLFIFSLSLTLFLSTTHHLNEIPNKNVLIFQFAMWSFEISVPFTILFIEEMPTKFMKKYINLPYIFYKLIPKKYKKRKLYSLLEFNFINSIISSKNINKISKYISKEDMFEFLDVYKEQLTYQCFLAFCKKKKQEEKVKIDKKDSHELLTKLVDNIYTNHNEKLR